MNNNRYKFRGKSIATNKWIEGNLFCTNTEEEDIFCIIPQDISWGNLDEYLEVVYPESVGQSTGLHDKTGKEIFEFDILEYEDRNMIMDSGVYVVEWDSEKAGWGLNGDNTCAGEVMKLSKVIGNKFEHPYLLNETK